jgi:hypothetical protein
MNANARVTTILLAITVFGCKGPLQTSAASVAAGSGSGDAAPSGTRVETIVDPTMNNEPAFYATVPAKWKFQGALLQGGPATCDSFFYSTYRVTSDDGQSFGEVMPQLLWVYGNGPKPKTGCLPIDRPMSAQDFLKNLSTTMQVAYLGDAPLPETFAKGVKQAQDYWSHPQPGFAANNLAAPRVTTDAAAAVVGFKSGSSRMKGRLAVFLQCTETTRPGFHSLLRGIPDTPPITQGKCTASVGYVATPENQFVSVVRLWDNPAMGLRQNTDWGNAWVKRHAEEGNKMNKEMIGRAEGQLATERQEVAHTMAVQQQMHNEFLDTMQRGTDMSMQRAADAAYSNHRMASDMVDYSLDRQTVLDTDTGTIYKITNQVTPGGTLQKLHGDGSPW